MRPPAAAGNLRATMDDLGAGFWFRFIGWLLLGLLALFVFLVIFVSGLFAWGILGTFLVLAAALLVVRWVFDRRRARRRTGTA